MVGTEPPNLPQGWINLLEEHFSAGKLQTCSGGAAPEQPQVPAKPHKNGVQGRKGAGRMEKMALRESAVCCLLLPHHAGTSNSCLSGSQDHAKHLGQAATGGADSMDEG